MPPLPARRADYLLALPRPEFRALLTAMSERQRKALRTHWQLWAHEGQLPPGSEWHSWLIMAGRGFGKTRAGAEWLRSVAEADPTARIAMVAASLGEARSIMVEGQSGLLATSPWGKRPRFEPSRRLLTWPNGAQAMLAGQAQKETFVNELAARVDALLHLAIEAESATPPATPSDGQSWLVGANPTGAWTGQAGAIAARASGNWLFLQPTAGMTLLNKATGQQIRYLSDWQTPAKPALPSGGTTIDTEARTAIGAILSALISAGIFAAS